MFYQDILLRETAALPEYLKRELLEFLFFLKKEEPAFFTTTGLPDTGVKPAFECGIVKIRLSPDFDAPLDDFKDYMQ